MADSLQRKEENHALVDATTIKVKRSNQKVASGDKAEIEPMQEEVLESLTRHGSESAPAEVSSVIIGSDTEPQAGQQRILLVERLLAEARRTSTSWNDQAMAEAYVMEIEKLHAEIRDYLGRAPEPIEAA